MCCGQKRSQMQVTLPRTRPLTVPSRPSLSRRSDPGTQGAPRSGNTLRNGESSFAPIASQTRDSASNGFIAMRYVQNAPVRVRGLASGLSYGFSGTHAVQTVDPRDVPGL